MHPDSQILYQIDNTGKTRIWSISYDHNIITIKYGVEGGAVQTKQERVSGGLGGRTLDEQVKSRVRSRVNKQLDRGYKASPEEALLLKGTNSMGMFKPMLAHKYKDVKDIDFEEAYMQHKYDGHRCLITNLNGEKIAYSRQGKLIPSIGHILKGIQLREGQTIDGELYCHGFNLQTIGSWIKREQDATKNLMYHAYDIVSAKPFNERFIEIEHAIVDPTVAIAVPTHKISSIDDVGVHFEQSRKLGYEGSIIRWGYTGYEVGKRSKSLVKVKHAFDGEFKVIDIKPSVDGWAVLTCLFEGKEFGVSAPGTILEKKEVLNNIPNYLGKYVTVEYANLTSDGVPFHGVALRWREDI